MGLQYIKNNDLRDSRYGRATSLDIAYLLCIYALSLQQFYKQLTYLLFPGFEVRDLNGRTHTGFAIAQTTNKNGSRISSARAFLRPARARPNLHMMLNTTVVKVLINQTDKAAYGVEVVNSYGQRQVIRASNEVIIR